MPVEIYVDEGGQGSNAELRLRARPGRPGADRRHAQPARRRRAVRGRRATSWPTTCCGPREGGRYLAAARLLDAAESDARTPSEYLETARRFRLATELYADRGGRAGVRLADDDGQRPGQGGDGADEGRLRGVPAAGGRGRLQRAERRHHAPRDRAARLGAAGVGRAGRGCRSRGRGGGARSAARPRGARRARAGPARRGHALAGVAAGGRRRRAQRRGGRAGGGVRRARRHPDARDHRHAGRPAGRDAHLPRGRAARLRHGRRRPGRRLVVPLARRVGLAPDLLALIGAELDLGERASARSWRRSDAPPGRPRRRRAAGCRPTTSSACCCPCSARCSRCTRPAGWPRCAGWTRWVTRRRRAGDRSTSRWPGRRSATVPPSRRSRSRARSTVERRPTRTRRPTRAGCGSSPAGSAGSTWSATTTS